MPKLGREASTHKADGEKHTTDVHGRVGAPATGEEVDGGGDEHGGGEVGAADESVVEVGGAREGLVREVVGQVHAVGRDNTPGEAVDGREAEARRPGLEAAVGGRVDGGDGDDGVGDGRRGRRRCWAVGLDGLFFRH